MQTDYPTPIPTFEKEKDFKRALEYFCERVEEGSIRSVVTYGYFKALLMTFYPEEYGDENGP